MSLPAALEQLPPTNEAGEWFRHVALRYKNQALGGVARYGRWSTDGGFSVLYLGRPRDSVVVEAYRHIVDPVDFDNDMDREKFISALVPRVVVACAVDVSNLIDLRTPLGRAQAGLVPEDLRSATNDTEAYARCQHVAQVAHQLRRHGIIAPAATGLGETLVLFTDILPTAELPTRSGPDETWVSWPSDPRLPSSRRHLRVADDPA